VTTGFRLLDQPNPNYKQYLLPRRTWLPSGLPAHGGKVTGGIILHDAEGGTDLVGEDMGAENVAQFICTRTTPGSYHVLVDRDSTIVMAPPDYEVWQDVASNPYTVGISVAWNKADLPRMTREQRDEYYRTFARAVLDMVAWFKRVKGITVPIDGFISRADILAGKPGLSTHSRMDPSRRTDPFGTGSIYEAEFLAVLANEAGNPTPTTSEEDDMFSDDDRARLHATQGKVDKIFYGVDESLLPAVTSVREQVYGLRTQTVPQLQGEIKGLTVALAQVAAGSPVDLDAVMQAAREGAGDGVAEALANVDADITLTIQKEA
jgi:hypothetical protein